MKKIRSLKKSLIMLPLLFISVVIFAQSSSISGTVYDPTGIPIPGVTVVIKGTTDGTITATDGSYALNNVDQNEILVFSFVGMNQQEITVAGKSVINVTLDSEVSELDEVVVVGYGVQRKEAVTGSVASISGDLMRDVPSPNVTQALQGRLPGVQMSQTSSKPGETMQIRIRGTRSLTASNDPLVVLDGIPFAGNIGDVSPNDIKSIDILKDASATAIYGSRGANGVILITTNKGRKGQQAKFTYNGYHGFKNAIHYPMMDGPTFIQLRETAGFYENNDIDESNDVSTDWQELLYRTGQVTSHDIGVSGGTEKGAYNFGIGYYLDESPIPTSNYQRISLRASIDQEVGEYFKFGFSTNSNYNLTEGSQIGLYSTLSLSPIADPYEEDGSFKRVINMPSDVTWAVSEEIINDNKDRWLKEKRGYGSYNNLYAELKIPGVQGLKYRLNAGLNVRAYKEGSYTGKGVGNSSPDATSTASLANSLTNNWVVENLLMYDRIFNGKHNVSLVGLYSSEQTDYSRSYIKANDIPNDALQYHNLGYANESLEMDPDNQRYELSGLISYMGRAMYTYDNRYMLTATIRTDASSRLAEGHKWHTYPAVSAGWNIANESFMESVIPINALKLRAGYGQTSNQAVSPYATLGLLKSEPYNHGDDTYVNGFYVSKLPNPNLGWEYSETVNLGLDFSLLNYRISGTVEYYITNTKDLLMQLGMPPTSGVKSFTENIGETQNKGVEFSINANILDDVQGFTWDVGFNLYANTNELVALASDQEEDLSNWWFVGHPVNVVYDYETEGLWQEGDPYMDILEPSRTAEEIPGMIKVKYQGEYNEDGSPVRPISSEDKVPIHLDPKFQGGFNTRLAYKEFDLGIVGTFQKGGVLISTLHSSMGWLNNLTGRRNNVDVDYWTPDNTGAKYPNPAGPKSVENAVYGSTMGYFDASYLKISTISLGYTVKKDLIQNAGFDQIRVYATLQNPLVLFSPFHKESGLDPTTNSYGDQNSAVGYSYNQRRILTVGTNTPQTRNVLFGLNITF